MEDRRHAIFFASEANGMLPRRLLTTLPLLLLVVAPAIAGERVITENFVVDAPTKELATKFGEYAEKYRQEKALDWLGYEIPKWPQKCPLKVKITLGQAGGATTFTFGSDGSRKSTVLSQEMQIFGEVKQLLNSVLPHEVTHTVLAHHFGQAVPRWADEGGSVLSENDEERFTHDVRCREILNQGRGIPLKHLFQMKEYPKDMIVVYAQGYSVCQYLIDNGGKKKFLQFVGLGMRSDNKNWEDAIKMYGFNSTDELQEAWIDALRKPPVRVAARNNDGRTSGSLTASRGPETRSSAVSGLPSLEPPVVARGVAPDETPVTPMKPSIATPPLPKLLPPEPPSKK